MQMSWQVNWNGEAAAVKGWDIKAQGHIDVAYSYSLALAVRAMRDGSRLAFFGGKLTLTHLFGMWNIVVVK
jgi:hypothetical protein